MDSSSLPGSTLVDLLNRAKAEDDPSDVFSTGCTPLDRLLGSDLDSYGLRRGTVVEVSGPPGSGKTAIALFLTLNALRRSHNVLWMSHRNPLPLERLSEMKTRGGQLGKLYQLEIDHTTQLMVLLSERRDLIPHCSIVVVDEMVHCDGVVSTRTEIMRRASVMAREKKVAVLVISSMKVARMDNSNYWISSMEYGKWEQYCETRVVLYRDEEDDDGDDNDSVGMVHAARWGSTNQEAAIAIEITANKIESIKDSSATSSPLKGIPSSSPAAPYQENHCSGTSDKEDKEFEQSSPSPKRIRRDEDDESLARDIDSESGSPSSEIPNSQWEIDL